MKKIGIVALIIIACLAIGIAAIMSPQFRLPGKEVSQETQPSPGETPPSPEETQLIDTTPEGLFDLLYPILNKTRITAPPYAGQYVELKEPEDFLKNKILRITGKVESALFQERGANEIKFSILCYKTLIVEGYLKNFKCTPIYFTIKVSYIGEVPLDEEIKTALEKKCIAIVEGEITYVGALTPLSGTEGKWMPIWIQVNMNTSKILVKQ